MRAPTMDDVAERAGVSRALVSLVMRDSGKVSERRRSLVLDAASELGYRRNATARSLAEQRSNTIGVVLNDLHNTFFADVVDGIHEAAVEAGYQLMLNTAWRHDADERQAIESFLEFRLDGVIVIGPRMTMKALTALGATAPLVSIGLAVRGIDSVVNDDELGGRLVAEHLLGLGHQRIVHIDGGQGAGARARRKGFVEALAGAGIEAAVVPGDFTEESGANAIEQILLDARSKAAPLPTAIFAANDLAATAALDRLKSSGVDVPGDVSVVGYDNTSIAGLHHIDLTTVHQPRFEMGQTGFRCVLERLAGRSRSVSHVVEPRLVERSTTGPAVIDSAVIDSAVIDSAGPDAAVTRPTRSRGRS